MPYQHRKLLTRTNLNISSTIFSMNEAEFLLYPGHVCPLLPEMHSGENVETTQNFKLATFCHRKGGYETWSQAGAGLWWHLT